MTERYLPPMSFGDDARSKLLEAGWEILSVADGSVLEAGFNPERIAATAGVSRRTFYRYFPDKYAYMMAMVETVLAESFSTAGLEVIGVMSQGDMVDLFESVKNSAEIYWETAKKSEAALARVALVTLAANSPGVLEAASVAFTAAIDQYVPAWDALFAELDLELRPPWTTRRFTGFVGALADGIMMRSLYDPELFDSIFPDVLSAMTAGIFRMRGEDIPELVNYDERLATEVRRRWMERQNSSESLAKSEVIAAALVRVLGKEGLRGTTLEALASVTGLTVGDVRVKGTVEEQVCAAVRQKLDSVQDELLFDARTQVEIAEIVRRHHARLRNLVAESPELFRALMEIRISGRSEELYRSAFDGLVAAGRASDQTDRFGAESVMAHAEQVILGELFDWSSRQGS